MHLPKSRLVHFFTLIVLLTVLSGCLPTDPGIWRNDLIKTSKRDDFHEMNTKLFQACKSGNVHDVENMMSQQLLDDNTAKLKIQRIGNHLKQSDYSVLDEFYIVHKYVGPQTIKPDSGHIDNYALNYQSVTREMYIGLFLSKSGADKYLITVLYAKYNYGWRIYFFDVKPYATSGKNATGLYNLAKQQYSRGYLMKAMNTMKLSRDYAAPSPIWLYQNDNEMDDFFRKLVIETGQKYRFPLFIDGVPGVAILGIDSQNLDGGVCPSVSYTSAISVSDTATLKKENRTIQKKIGKIFPGIDQDEKYIYYTAFNKLPKGKHGSPPFFDITEKLK
jgi:hypothetical protein